METTPKTNGKFQIALDLLRLTTPVLLALCLYILSGLNNDVDKLANKMDNVRERLIALETQVHSLK